MEALTKDVKSPMDITVWEKTMAYHELVGFIMSVNQEIAGKPISKAPDLSESVRAICQVFEEAGEKIAAFPPDLSGGQRFGYPAYRDWFDWFHTEAPNMVTSLLDSCSTLLLDLCTKSEAALELSDYLRESVGNRTRIDYGTGHELAFVAFLTCLFKVGFLGKPDQKKALASVGLTILPCYLNFVRKLQLTYRLEPAGSHGVWCLDDYQFIPFLWGSSQLKGQMDVDPAQIATEKVYDQFADEYVFFGCLQYIVKVKTGPFFEHSPTLHGISGVPHWEKVNHGMIKMYKAEVLGKFPVVQHFGFGKLLPYQPAPTFQKPTSRPPLKL